MEGGAGLPVVEIHPVAQLVRESRPPLPIHRICIVLNCPRTQTQDAPRRRRRWMRIARVYASTAFLRQGLAWTLANIQFAMDPLMS